MIRKKAALCCLLSYMSENGRQILQHLNRYETEPVLKMQAMHQVSINLHAHPDLSFLDALVRIAPADSRIKEGCERVRQRRIPFKATGIPGQGLMIIARDPEYPEHSEDCMQPYPVAVFRCTGMPAADRRPGESVPERKQADQQQEQKPGPDCPGMRLCAGARLGLGRLCFFRHVRNRRRRAFRRLGRVCRCSRGF